jgi:hypothetical protein
MKENDRNISATVVPNGSYMDTIETTDINQLRRSKVKGKTM